ncbi:MAG: Glycosyl transferase, group 1 [Candidatus Woesebacteria bacterium GW2011_GWB1_39_10]|uniref:Glycosyl transferase, group 1 n=1 Tax=Candidatus Woesebacteria bacterium GW2011_GWB1_39_10 TaxID=1618572 RepID=A0A0G0PQ53_9BACT|nr:MAG: Glycosyl transferase, group 1 [Candidatus Woesebacteria bacterium GW2011_GWB1_39_10]
MKFNVLVAPAHYLFSDRIKSENAWSYALVKTIGSRVKSMDVLSGIKDLSSNISENINVYSLFSSRSDSLLTEFARRILFYPLITLYALKLMMKKEYKIVHHMLPLSYATFNPLMFFIHLLHPKSRIILGPLQLPQVQSDQQDMNVVFTGKQQYTFLSKIIYYLTLTLTNIVKPFSKLMFESADLVVCNSKTSLKFYSSMFPKAKFSVIYTGLDAQNLVPIKRKLNTKKIKLLCAGVFSKRKGQIYLLKAMVSLVKKHPNLELTLIGGGDQDNIYRDFVSKNKLEKYVKFTGQISYSDYLLSFQGQHIFCLPTLSDTSPYVILEAMAFGLPIVATDIGSIREMVGKAGIIVKPEDVKPLETALTDMINNPKLRLQMSKYGIQRIQKYFTWDKISEQWVNEYNNLLT